MRYMFCHCKNLKALDVSKFNTKNVTNMKCMFHDCQKLEALNISKFNTNNVKDMSYMFARCRNIKTGITDLKTPKNANTKDMYLCCEKLDKVQEIVLEDAGITCKYYTNGLLEVTGTGELRIPDIYSGGQYFYPWDFYRKYITKAKINIQGATDFTHLFSDCSLLENVDFSGTDTSKIVDMSYMFDSCTQLENIDLSQIDTSNVTNMSYMFNSCTQLENIDFSQIDTSNVTNMSFMFRNCKKLNSLGVETISHQANTKTIGMFAGCYQYKPDDYYEEKTGDFVWRFYNNGLLEVTGSGELINDEYDEFYGDVEPIWNGYQPFIKQAKLEVSGITTLTMLFKDCTQLEQVDLSKLDTSNVTSVNYMFSNCSKLKNGKETLKLPDTVDTTLLNRDYIPVVDDED
ncbi:MAG: BspA family leucine-rich repeat surface protein [Lachnospiraceae bacterium]|nr:BspA family leucine-rich repeat surface protein [Lachnospiraceae bacterium]